MRSRAKVEIKGRIASDLAEATVNDKKVVNFRVAVDRRPRKGSTEKPETDFFSVSVWGKNGENCKQHLVKGQWVEIAGRLQNRTVNAGTEDRVTYTQIIADNDGVDFGPKPMKKAA